VDAAPAGTGAAKPHAARRRFASSAACETYHRKNRRPSAIRRRKNTANTTMASRLADAMISIAAR